MTSKYFILSLCLCIFSITVMGQEKNYDRDVDGLRVCSGENDTVFNYETLSGQKLIVYSSCLDFCMGRDSLNAYVRRMFRIRTDYEYDELLQYIIFVILFDADLNIVEIRQLPPDFCTINKEHYKKVFESILKGTHGMWCKKIEGKDWYIYWFILRNLY